MAISLVKNLLKADPSKTRYYVQGKQIQLGRLNFKAQGGEGAIYVKGSTAYKIYSDPQRALSPEKLQELSVLTQANIIRPLTLIVDRHNQPAGYTMRYVGKTHALCQLFPKAFRVRNNLTPEMTLGLVRKLQAGVTHIHSKQILLVDLNELNFLVTEDFRELYFIDVDSYQTPSFPATVLMESVRDRHSSRFSIGSDFFSFAVVSFQLFVGIHPYKGNYPPLQQITDKANKLDTRMRHNVSVLHKGVTVPASCLPFSVIPPIYLDWYRSVFEEGKREAPPDGVRAVLQLSTQASSHHIGSTVFLLQDFREFDSEVISCQSGITITERSVYFDGQRFDKPPFDVKVGVSPRTRHVIVAFTDHDKLRFHDLTDRKDIQTDIDGDVMSTEGRFYVKQNENVFEVDFIELPNNMLLGLRPVANVMMNATRLFEGVAIQNLLGTSYASIPMKNGACHQVRLSELDDFHVIDARIERNILMIVATQKGKYDKFVYRFGRDFADYDLLRYHDISSIDLNFTVLDTGVVIHRVDDNKLELFAATTNSSGIRTIQDPLLETDIRLFHTGKQALIAQGRKLCKISLQQ